MIGAELGQVRATPDYLLVLDFECTCEQTRRSRFLHEVIEVPVLLLHTATRTVVDTFHSYVRPTEEPRLSAFCTSLTGIEQHMVDDAPPLRTVLERLAEWMRHYELLPTREMQHVNEAGGSDAAGSDASYAGEAEQECCEQERTRTWAFATDGPWDFECFLFEECARKELLPQLRTIGAVCWVDVRQHFASFRNGNRRCNTVKMLQLLGRSFTGRRHSGLVDAQNLAVVANVLLDEGARLSVNDCLFNTSARQRYRGRKHWGEWAAEKIEALQQSVGITPSMPRPL